MKKLKILDKEDVIKLLGLNKYNELLDLDTQISMIKDDKEKAFLLLFNQMNIIYLLSLYTYIYLDVIGDIWLENTEYFEIEKFISNKKQLLESNNDNPIFYNGTLTVGKLKFNYSLKVSFSESYNLSENIIVDKNKYCYSITVSEICLGYKSVINTQHFFHSYINYNICFTNIFIDIFSSQNLLQLDMSNLYYLNLLQNKLLKEQIS